jgi:hypothetical protein
MISGIVDFDSEADPTEQAVEEADGLAAETVARDFQRRAVPGHQRRAGLVLDREAKVRAQRSFSSCHFGEV